MNRFEASVSLKGLFSGEHRKPTLVLLLTPFVLTAWKYYGSVQFYHDHLSSVIVLFNDPLQTAEYYHFLSALMMLGGIPLLVIRLLFKERLSAYGMNVGDWRFGLKAIAVLAPILILSTYPSSTMPDFRAEYPFFRGTDATAMKFVSHALMYMLYYVGWEIFFRGFMQFGLRSTFGAWNAVLVQTVASCLVHIGKPDGEIFSSILGGIAWGVIAFRTNSIIYVFLMHWLLGVSLDFFILYF